MLAIPSREDAFSQTAIIGLAHGVPVIGTDVDGLATTLGGGRGTLVAPDDPRALAAALELALSGALPRPVRAADPRGLGTRRVRLQLLDQVSRAFAAGWNERLRPKERRGEGLSWDSPGFEAP